VVVGRGTIKVGAGFVTGNPKVYAGGDAVTGPAMVIDAIAAGQKAAAKIDETIRAANCEKAWTPPKEEVVQIPFEVDEEAVETPQAKMPELAPAARKGDFREVETGYTLDVAIAEARRCMRCDGKPE
jgi:NADH-quinone oxidoreductase subunit F